MRRILLKSENGLSVWREAVPRVTFRKARNRAWMALLCLCLLSSPTHLNADEDLQSIQTILNAYSSTIRSLSGRFKLQGIPSAHSQKLYPGGLIAEDQTSLVDFAVDLAANRRRYDSRRSWVHGKLSKEPFEMRTITSFDGQQSYHLLHTFTSDPVKVGLPSEVPYRLNIFRQDDTGVRLMPEHAAGLHMKWLSASLGSILRSGSTELEGREKIGGASCYRISVDKPANQSNRLVVWLDPAHGYLPRRQEWINLGKPRKPPYHDADVLETTEFRQYPVPGGAHVWFPYQSQLRTWIDTVQTLEILELRINPPLEAERFRIDPATLPDGVRVYHLSGKTTFTGGRQDLWQERQQLYDEHSKIMDERLGIPPAPPPQSHPGSLPIPRGSIQAEPPDDRLTFGLLIAGVSLLILATGMWLIAKSRRKVCGGQ